MTKNTITFLLTRIKSISTSEFISNYYNYCHKTKMAIALNTKVTIYVDYQYFVILNPVNYFMKCFVHKCSVMLFSI